MLGTLADSFMTATRMDGFSNGCAAAVRTRPIHRGTGRTSLLTLIAQLRRKLGDRLTEARTRRTLNDLTDHQLRDIGLTREQIPTYRDHRLF